MWVGDVVADRFLVERPIGSGGMGSVFLAVDRETGGSVALKALDLADESAVERFRREARVLSELSHPGVVRYIAHGETPERQPFLAMELLEGEDLAQRLARGALSTEASVTLVRQAADALAFAHGKGVIHRDIKPSNLFLVGGDLGRLKVLDFGIARATLQTQGMTQTGAMLGTLGYMAPEQAMGARDVDARADVFALGCVLFECLTGRQTFVGGHAVAILAKVLTEEPPRVSEVRPEIGEGLDSLVARLLAKKPSERPNDAAAVLRLLDALGAVEMDSVRPVVSQVPGSLTHSEQQVVSVILAEATDEVALTMTATPEQVSREIERVREVAARFGAELTILQGSALVLVLKGKGTASDQAMQAASCALVAHQILPNLRFALATGRAETSGRLPVGAAIDRATTLLHFAAPHADSTVRVDDVTAGLLGPRFEVRREGSLAVLAGELGELDSQRTLLGKPTPTVGREKEIGLLEATLAECIDDSVARLVLVTAPPGTGKSRLATEFLARARRTAQARVFVARAESVGGGTALAVARRLIRRAAGLREGEPVLAQQARFFEYMRALLPEEEPQHTAEFVGEAIGLPTPHRPSPRLVAARNDPRLVAERVRHAIPTWLDAESARGPLVLILEDLHWADAESVAQVEASLGRLADRPLLVVALGRPEARALLPTFWNRSGALELRLDGLTRRAAERLVHAVLGKDTNVEIVSRIVERAGGNAFYLEELIRSAAEGREGLPETVTAMAATRLERLDPEARRVLRAVSVFGEACWDGGVSALLGGDSRTGPWLEALVDDEVLRQVPESRFAGQREYTFRHALLGDAAYGMLIENDRRAAHALAGEWLGRIDGIEPLTVAEHFEKAEDLVRAAPWLVKATSKSFFRASPIRIVDLGDRALAAGATGLDRGLVRALQAAMAVSLGNARLMIEAGQDGIRLLPATRPEWFWAAGSIMAGESSEGSTTHGTEILSAVLALHAMPPATGPLGWALMNLTSGAIMFGQSALAQRILQRMDEAAAAAGGSAALDLDFAGYHAMARYWVDCLSLDDVALGLAAALECERHFNLSESRWSVPVGIYYVGFALREAGRLDEAVVQLERASQLFRKIGNEYALGLARTQAAVALADSGADEGLRLLRSHLEATDAISRSMAQLALAALYLRAHDAAGAESCLPPLREIKTASAPTFHRVMRAIHAKVRLAGGATGEALALAERAAAGQEDSPMLPLYRSIVLLTHAECLHAAGRDTEACEAIRIARERLLRIAGGFEDVTTRHSYLTNIEPNARTLALAAQWRGETG